MPWRERPDPPAVLRRYVDRLKAEVVSASGADPSHRIAVSWLAWLLRDAVSRGLRAVLFVCFAPLGLAISGLLSLGVARGRRQGMRRIRRAARALGAADGLLMNRQSGAGVFGEGHDWAVFTT